MHCKHLRHPPLALSSGVQYFWVMTELVIGSVYPIMNKSLLRHYSRHPILPFVCVSCGKNTERIRFIYPAIFCPIENTDNCHKKAITGRLWLFVADKVNKCGCGALVPQIATPAIEAGQAHCTRLTQF